MEKLNKILSAVLGIKESEINDNLTPNDIETWDSMNSLILAAEIERSFSIKITSADVINVKCVGDIKRILQKYGVKITED